MSIVLDEAAINHLTHSTFGLVGRDTARRTAAVLARTIENASGLRLDIRSGLLVSRLRARVEGRPTGVIGIVSTDAVSNHSLKYPNFAYPKFLQIRGGPHGKGIGWMTAALPVATENLPGVFAGPPVGSA